MHIGLTRECATGRNVIRARVEAVCTDGRRLVNFQLTEGASASLSLTRRGGPGLYPTTAIGTLDSQVTADLGWLCNVHPRVYIARCELLFPIAASPGLIGHSRARRTRLNRRANTDSRATLSLSLSLFPLSVSPCFSPLGNDPPKAESLQSAPRASCWRNR